MISMNVPLDSGSVESLPNLVTVRRMHRFWDSLVHRRGNSFGLEVSVAATACRACLFQTWPYRQELRLGGIRCRRREACRVDR